jgi:ribose-phosphate pyrophosphokinase
VLPQFPYSRQERKKTRESITALQVARFLEASGADRVITIDIHSEAIEGFLTKAHLENLHAYRTIGEYFEENFPTENLMVVAPDVGSADRARAYAKIMDTGLAIVDKERSYDRQSDIKGMSLVGDVEGKNVFMGDDLVATGGTLIKASQLLKEKGAQDIYLACSLPFFSGDAVERFDEAHQEGIFTALIGTDAVFRGERFRQEHPWYREVSVAPLFARVIHNINQKRSVSKLLR